MSRIKGKNTLIERQVFRFLRREGVYFQRHYKRLAGCPDIAIPSKKLAVFIDGDFWHGWKFDRTKKRLPKFWREKIEYNIRRDRKNRAALRRKGWKTLRIWEHDLGKKKVETTLNSIALFLKDLPPIQKLVARKSPPNSCR